MLDATIIISVISLIVIVLVAFISYKLGAIRRDKFWEDSLPEHRKEAIAKSRAVLGGQFSEQIAPFLPDFPYSPTECRFVGKPVDFIVFKGADNKQIDEVVFVEVKSGNSKLSPQEKNLKSTIEQGRVRFEEYRVPEEMTKKKEVFKAE